MLDRFNLYTDIFEFSNRENFARAAEKIMENSEKNIISYVNDGGLLQNFSRLVKNEISQEHFFSVGDVESKEENPSKHISPMEAVFQIYYFLYEEEGEGFENSLIFVDKKASDYFRNFSQSKHSFVGKKLSEKNSLILEI